MPLFQPTKLNDLACKRCQFNTTKNKEKVNGKVDDNLLLSKTLDPKSPRVLIYTTTPPDERYLQAIVQLVFRYGIKNFDIYSALRCKAFSFDSITLQNVFESCNFDLDIKKYSLVITFGNAFKKAIECNDFVNWLDFTEVNFNQTFIYTPIYKNHTIKIFPLPPLFEKVKKRNRFVTKDYINHTKSDSFEGYFIDHQMRQVKDELNSGVKKRLIPVKTVVVDNPNAWLKERIEKDLPDTEIALDTETNSLNQYIEDFKVSIVIISYDGKTSYILRYKDIDKKLFDEYLSTKVLIGANIKYDVKSLLRLGQSRDVFRIKDDIITLYHVLNTVAGAIGLKIQSWFHGFGGYDKELDDFKKEYKNLLLTDGKLDYTKIPEKIMFNYAGYDGALTYRIRDALYRNPQQEAIKAYQEKIIPSFDTFIDMEIFGIPFDRKEALEINKRIFSEMKQLDKEIFEYFKTEFEKNNIDISKLADFKVSSDDKLREAIIQLGWPVYDTTETGKLSVGEDNLIYWKKDGYDICDSILKYRGKASLSQTHLTGWANYVSSYDKVVHPNINQARAGTLRATHTEPNSGNIPAHGESSKIIRPLFFKNKIVFEYDYSGFQLRIMAIYSKDKVLLDTYINDGDLHSETGAFIFHKNMDVNEFRKFAKDEIEPYSHNRFKSKCFVAGTKIRTNKGDLPIEEFVPEVNPEMFTPYLSDDIKLVDRHGNEKEIESTWFGYTDELVIIEVENGDEITVTPNHNFPVLRDGKEVKVSAGDLILTSVYSKDTLITENGKPIKIKNMKYKRLDAPVKIYCFHEPINHECLVAGEHDTYASYQSLNFGMFFSDIFGVVIPIIKKEWAEEDIEEYFKDNQDYLPEKDWIFYKRQDGTQQLNLISTVAKIIWTKFFTKYEGVLKYIKNQHKLAKQGWVDGHFGTKRHLPYLMVDGQFTDKDLYKGYENISVNSDIQTFEALSMYTAMKGIRDDFIKLGLWGNTVQINVTTHDSLTGSIPDDRADLIPVVNEVMMRNMEIRDRSKYLIDFTVEGAFYKVWKDKDSVIAKFG